MRKLSSRKREIEELMTPEQIATMAAIAGLIKSIGTWPVLSILILGNVSPWIMMVFLSVSMHKRVEIQAKMYEDNVILVKEVTELAKGYRDQLVWSIQTVDQANSIANNNRFCPLVRKNSTQQDVQG